MSVKLYHICVDARDPHALAAFWAAALGQQILAAEDDEVVVGAAVSTYPGLCFLRVPETKTIKNRLHLDLDPDDRNAEVARLLELGAKKVDIGQGPDVTWEVLSDPEGNEFCVLRPHRSLID
jgi:hypothetical protein